MAYICTKKVDCQKCDHFRFDDDRGEKVCWAKQDEENSRKDASVSKTPVARLKLHCTASYESHLEIPKAFLDVDGNIIDEEALIEYINDHKEECPIDSPLEYVTSSDWDVDVEDLALGNIDIQSVDTDYKEVGYDNT